MWVGSSLAPGWVGLRVPLEGGVSSVFSAKRIFDPKVLFQKCPPPPEPPCPGGWVGAPKHAFLPHPALAERPALRAVIQTCRSSAAADIWSLGCTIIEMATARVPWSEQQYTSPYAALFNIAQACRAGLSALVRPPGMIQALASWPRLSGSFSSALAPSLLFISLKCLPGKLSDFAAEVLCGLVSFPLRNLNSARLISRRNPLPKIQPSMATHKAAEGVG